MTRMLTINPERCTNCRLCELACSFRKTGEFNPTRSRIRVHAFPEECTFVPLACFQCADTPCAKTCPSAALVREEGIVRYNRDNCIGCKMCMLACPFGVVTFEAATGEICKCDTCDGDPECVRFCTQGALAFEEGRVSGTSKGEDLATRVVRALRA